MRIRYNIVLLCPLILTAILLSSCNESPQSAIKKVYGEKVIAESFPSGDIFILSYKDKSYKQDDAFRLLKNKFDYITNVIGNRIGEFMGDDKESYFTIYHWETPKIRITMTNNRSLNSEDNFIEVIVSDKSI